MDGWLDGWMGGWMDGWSQREADRTWTNIVESLRLLLSKGRECFGVRSATIKFGTRSPKLDTEVEIINDL